MKTSWTIFWFLLLGSAAFGLSQSFYDLRVDNDLTVLGLVKSPTVETAATLSNQGELRFSEQTGNGSNYVGLEGPDSVSSDVVWKLPASDGTAGFALKTDGAGNLSWGTVISDGVSSTGNVDFSFTDEDTTDQEPGAILRTNCTDLASGVEDCDFSLRQVINGVEEDRFVADADGHVDFPIGAFRLSNESYALRFGTSQDTSGIWSSDGFTLQFSSLGNHTFQVSNNAATVTQTLAAVKTGTPSSVSLSVGRGLANDIDNGLISDTADQVQVVNGGVESAEFTSTEVDFSVPVKVADHYLAPITNYFKDVEANDVSNVSTYDDVSAAVNLDGGTPNVTATLETSTPLSGGASYLLTKDAVDRQHEGWAIPSESLDRMESNGPGSVWIRFSYESSADYQSNDIQVFTFRVDGGSGRLEACSTIDGTNNLPAAPNGGTYTCFLGFDPSDTSFRLGLHIATTNANSYTVKTDRIRYVVEPRAPSAIVTNPVYFTPSWNGLTIGNGSQSWKWWRVGSTMYIQGQTSFGSTTSITGSVSMDLPVSGVTIGHGVAHSMGFSAFNDADNTDHMGILGQASSTSIRPLTGTGAAPLNATTPFTWAVNDVISFFASIEIAEWEASNTVSSAYADLRNVKMRAYLSAHQVVSSTGLTTIVFDVEDFDSHSAFDTSTGIFTAPVDGYYFISGNVLTTLYNSNDAWTARISGSPNTLNYFVTHQGNPDPAVNFSALVYLKEGEEVRLTTDSTTDSSYSIIGGASANSNFTIFGIPDFKIFGINGVSEYLSATSSVFTPGSSGVWYQMTGNSITLKPGTWRISGYVTSYSQSGVASFTSTNWAWSTNNGDNTAVNPTVTTVDAGKPDTQSQTETFSENQKHYSVDTIRKTVTEEEDLYLTVKFQMTNPSFARLITNIYAERLK